MATLQLIIFFPDQSPCVRLKTQHTKEVPRNQLPFHPLALAVVRESQIGTSSSDNTCEDLAAPFQVNVGRIRMHSVIVVP